MAPDSRASGAARWWWLIAAYAGPHRRTLAVLLLIQLALGGLNALSPWPLKLVIDNVLPQEPLPDALGWLAATPLGRSTTALLLAFASGTVVLLLLKQGLTAITAVLETTAGRRMTYALAEDTLAQLFRRSAVGLREHAQGDVLARLDRDARCAEQFVFAVAMVAVGAIANLAVMAVIMVRIHAVLAGMALLVAPPLWIVIHRRSRPMTALSQREAAATGALLGGAEGALQRLPEVQSFTAEEREMTRLRRLAAGWHRAGLAVQWLLLRFELGVTAVTAMGTAALFGLGGYLVLDGQLTIGALVVYVSYLTALYGPLTSLAYLLATYAEARAGAHRVLELWGQETVIADPPEPVALPAPAAAGARVELIDVTVGYEPGRPVLRHLTLDVSPGEAVALVGLSGAGKSTLAALLPRFLDPWSGAVRLDGVDLRHARVHDIRRRVAVVHQDTVLLPGTVSDNIAYGRPEASAAGIRVAAQRAGAHEFIIDLPHGYDTVLGEGGSNLSGGQRQRLAIARAFLKDAPLLVLDEPTSALDSHSEALVVDALRRIARQRTVIVIAHRHSTIQHVDRVITLHDGTISSTHPPLEPAHGT